MIIKKENVKTSKNKNKSRYLFLIIFMIMSLNGFVISEQGENGEKGKSKVDFEPGASSQSKLKKKIPPNAKISPNGKNYYMQDGKKSISCYKITNGEKDEKLWSETFEDNLKKD